MVPHEWHSHERYRGPRHAAGVDGDACVPAAIRAAHRAEQSQGAAASGAAERYGTYAGLLVEFRQAMMHHWFCEHEGQDADDEVAIRRRSFELRSSTQHALFQLQLITDEPELIAVAVDAFTAVGKIDRATDRTDVIVRRDVTRDLIDAFVGTARQHV